ncbi:hypothetical protein H5J25_09675 [Sphingomonas aliaeris]|uniref:CHAD domain-containing protein n=1 Tax=Sphingomonas aliaeris TaxID=2759526 RepID=A0A974S2R4_9SPHN|nr:hypothetical protein [Sphingomonas aliaeris]QQV75882.1 hypothetical protein H5J25_09675 [Sphingomonas aliaeris]
MKQFPTDRLDALFQAILVNDVVDARVDLPSAIRTDYPAAHLADGFAISAQLWREGFDRTELLAFIDRLRRGADMDQTDQLWFKHVRAKFKHLRFAFVLYGADHSCPRLFKSITTSMGLLQDAFRNGRQDAIGRQSFLLKLMLSRPMLAWLNREVDRIRLDTGAGFRDFTTRQVATLRETLSQPTLNGHRFHAARKIVSRQVSFHDDMRTIHPAPEHLIMSRYLSAINGLMGRYHDELVLRHALGELDYAHEQFALPADIRHRLERVATLYP